ncbi:MAG: sugar transferase [Anaerolineae bacterium]
MIEGRTQNAPWMGRATLNTWRAEARPLYRWSKRALDLALALVGLVLLAPVLAAIAIAIKWDSPGPVIFAQERVGKDGRLFTLYKFRSMVHNHGKEEAHRAYARDFVNGHHRQDGVFKPSNGDVVTRVGRFLRKSSLDELPQLWNILKGEMSFVGPRPLVAAEMEAAAPWQRRRLEALPGLTGLVQVSGRSSLTFEKIARLDIYYVENCSLWLDLKIMLKTIPAVISGESTC